MSSTQQAHDCDDHTIVDPATREVVYGCTVIYGLAEDGRVLWESHADASIDPAGRVNPDYPAYDHTGDGAPAPIDPVAPVYPDWVQPQGAHDAYQLGDRVAHNAASWQSNLSANVWEPGVYGWSGI